MRESVSITEREAVKLKVVDFIADNLTDLLTKANGRTVEVSFNSDLNRLILKLKSDSGEIIRQVPPEDYVRFLTRLPSRTLSRSRYAGREFLLGIVSICMTQWKHDSLMLQLSHRVAYMATIQACAPRANAQKPTFRREFRSHAAVSDQGTSV